MSRNRRSLDRYFEAFIDNMMEREYDLNNEEEMGFYDDWDDYQLTRADFDDFTGYITP